MLSHNVNFGITSGRSPHRQFGIKRSDRLFHMFFLGQTGTGKTSLLLSMALQDVEEVQGFCLIDPHGDLADSVILKSRNALYWNVADPLCGLGYNPLAYVSVEYRPLVVSGLIDALKKQWSKPSPTHRFDCFGKSNFQHSNTTLQLMV
jgi:hypothetical protein